MTVIEFSIEQDKDHDTRLTQSRSRMKQKQEIQTPKFTPKKDTLDEDEDDNQMDSSRPLIQEQLYQDLNNTLKNMNNKKTYF